MKCIRDPLSALPQCLRRAALGLVLAVWGLGLTSGVSAQSLLDTFNPTANDFVQALAVQADGKVLVGGAFTSIGGQGRSRLARLDADGSVDTAFVTVEVNGTVFSVVALPNGKMVIGGNFSLIRSASQAVGTGTTRNGIAQLNADGSLDTAFNPNAVANGGQGNVFRILPLASGKMLVGGHFTNISGAGRSKIARLNADGSVDTSFNAGVMNVGDYLWNLAEQPDGKLLVSGGFTQVGGVARNNVARLEANGVVDAGFIANVTYATAGWYPSVNTTLLQSDGRIVITGQFDRVNGLARTNLARLNSNGSVDTSYSTANTTNAGIHWALIQPDGKVVIGGSFSNVGVLSQTKVARLDADGTLDNSFSQQTITAGDVYTLARHPDGKIIAGGTFTEVSGQPRTRLARLYGKRPTAVTEPFQQVSAGAEHTCALTAAGAVKCWGRNYNGQLGDGSFIDRALPTTVTGLGSGVESVSTSNYHTCAVTTAGLVKCWGYNGEGQLGDGTTTNRPEPVAVTGLAGAVSSVTAGGTHSCALMTTGAVFCWGRNYDGQLGDGTQIDRLSPTAVVGLGSGVQTISTGHQHSCALTTAGAVRCWGYAVYGQLGDGNAAIRSLVSVAVTGLSSGVQAIDGGDHYNCALTAIGAIRCWGYNVYGAVGDGTTIERRTPVAVSGMSSGALAIGGGGYHSCAVVALGAAWCWGYNVYGQLGDGTTTHRLTPVAVSGLGSGTRSISGGGGHSCALSTTGFVRCWGWNGRGQLGDGTNRDRLVPVALLRYAFVVTPSAGNGGTIAAALPQTLDAGTRGSFTLSPNPNHHVVSVGGTCGGTLSGNVFTTDIIGGDCSVVAAFGIDIWTVTPSVVGGHGSITPSTPQTVNDGSATIFTLVPEVGYVATVAGTCGGSLAGNVYTTNTITANCTVIASFTLDTRTVTPSVVGGHGSITPSTPQTVNYGATTSFTIAADSGYIGHVAGTCGGTLAGIVYTTNAITANCTVIASFASAQASLTITNNRSYSRYGMMLNYLVTLLNNGATDLTGTLSSLLPSQLDTAASTWICVEPGIGVQCSATGSGSLNDNVVVPAGRSVSWLVSAPVRMNADEPSIDYSVTFTSALLPAPISAVDHDTLVLFRHGFDREYDDGTQAPTGQDGNAATASAAVSVDWDGQGTIAFTPSPIGALSAGTIDVLLAAAATTVTAIAAGDEATRPSPTHRGLRMERLSSPTRHRLRLVTIDDDGTERSSRWVTGNANAVLQIAIQHDESGSHWLLTGTSEPLEMPAVIASGANTWKIAMSPQHADVMVCTETCEQLQ